LQAVLGVDENLGGISMKPVLLGWGAKMYGLGHDLRLKRVAGVERDRHSTFEISPVSVLPLALLQRL
jgi:hypothetical protein